MERGRKLAVVSFCVTGWVVVFLLAAAIILSAQSPPSRATERLFVWLFAAAFTFSAILSAAALFRLEKGGMRKAVAVELAVIILFLVSVVLPGMLPPKKTDGVAWISTLRTVSSAQELYYSEYGVYATFTQLRDADMLNPLLAETTSPATARRGYYYVLEVDDAKGCCCFARPARWGETGKRNYLITQDGIIYWNETENGSEFTKLLGRD